ncbi:MAG: DUF2955 domain-containing protein [Azonexus sp.]
MPTEASAALAVAKARPLDDPRIRRILRFTIGVTLATAYTSYVNWSFSFLTVALIISLLTMPTPAPSLRFAVWTVAKLLAFTVLGLALMLPLHSHQLFGFALVGLILFIYFYLQAQGRMVGLNATFIIIGATLVPAFGAGSMDGGVEFAKGLSQSALTLFPIIWICYAVLPEGVFPGLPNAPRIEGSSSERAIIALRPVVLLLPLVVYMFSNDNAIRYMIGYYQAAMIAQHASRATSRALAIELFLATVIGATAGLVLWWLLKAWPSLLWFTLLMALFSFLFATRIFDNGPRGLSPQVVRWSYGLTTLVFIVFPDAMTQGFSGDSGSMKFYQRILDYALVTSYSVFGVLVYDAVVDRLRAWRLLSARQDSA